MSAPVEKNFAEAVTSGVVVLGRISGPSGIQGDLKLHPFGDDPENWGEMPLWWIAPAESGPWQPEPLVRIRSHGSGWVFRLKSVQDRNQAEALKGWWVGAPREALPKTDPNEYYWADLLGMQVVNTASECLGQVVGLLETGAHQVLRVQPSGDAVASDRALAPERLLPFVAAVVLEVNLEARVIRVDWGLDW